MPSPGLPVNIDSAYADSGADPSFKTHQQHHDTIHDVVNRIDTTAATVNGQVLAWSTASSTYIPALRYTLPAGGIPESDLVAAVQTKLNYTATAPLALSPSKVLSLPNATAAAAGAMSAADKDKLDGIVPGAALTLASMPAGFMMNIDQAKGGYGAAAGSYPASRPTARTDITVVWTGVDDPGARAIAGDKWDRTG